MYRLNHTFKRVLFCLLLTFVGLSDYAQKVDTTIYSTVDVMPSYPGGTDSLFKNIAANIVYPQFCADFNIQGKVYLRFVINTDGSPLDLQVVKSPHPALSVAAMDAILKVGKFNPGLQAGKPVKVWYSVPVSFKIKTATLIPEQKDSVIIGIRDYFQGGGDAFDAFLKKNLLIPRIADSLNLDALILVKCKLIKSLKVIPYRIMNDPDSIFSKEVLRLFDLMPPFNDSIKKIDKAGTSLLLAIQFSINQLSLATESINLKWTRGGDFEQESYYNLGVRLFKTKYYHDALKAFNNAITLNPRDADAFYNRGMVKIQLNLPNACEDFKRAYLLGTLDSKAAIEQNCR